ncbi:hypothetical protein SNE40_020907 [Patella caerulea]
MMEYTEANADLKYIYFTGMDDTYWKDASDNCAKMNGKLAKDIAVSDWELRSDGVDSFLTNLYWIGLTSVNGEWVWHDGSPVDLNDTQAWPLRPEFEANITYDCVLWNPVEPFYIPSKCDDIKSYVCELETGTTCSFASETNMAINETGWTPLTASDDADLANKMSLVTNETLIYIKTTDGNIRSCEQSCEGYRGNISTISQNLECWMAEYRTSNGSTECRLVLLDGQPVMVETEPDRGTVTILSRFCFDLSAYLNETCDCRCTNISAPTSMAEVLVEVEKTQNELRLSTKNLSATVRKYISAPDQRKTSSSLGYVGIAALGIVLGGLVVADISAMVRDVKRLIYNVKGVCS